MKFYHSTELQYWGVYELIEHILWLQDIVAEDMQKESEK